MNLSPARPGELFGEFFGHDLEQAALDEIAKTTLASAGLRESPGLFQTKWFDYRRLHPVLATYLFAHFYSRAYRRMMVRRVGIERGLYMRGFSGGDIFLRLDLYRGFWRARQTADQHGIPYDYYNNFAIRWADSSLWKNLPRPAQLTGEKLLDALLKSWEKDSSETLRLPEDPHFMARNYAQLPEQVAFQNWLCGRIERHPSTTEVLASALYVTEMLDEGVAIAHFGEAQIQRAKSLWGF
jgi:hypothetical protein